jgi:F-type H+-transporting ATPase subunit a
MGELNINPGMIKVPFLGGMFISETIVVTWLVMLVLIIFSCFVRFFLLKGFKEIPSGLQNIIEFSIESIEKFSKGILGEIGGGIAPYIFTLAAFIGLSGFIELLGLRAPTADLSLTATLAIVTFFLINYFAIRHKGLMGRIKDLGKPVFFIAPINVLVELALPVSLSCRLFGNMLGGLIVMDILYKVVPIGIPAILSIYFNLFHALVQTFVFILLSLTFIKEAVE